MIKLTGLSHWIEMGYSVVWLDRAQQGDEPLIDVKTSSFLIVLNFYFISFRSIVVLKRCPFDCKWGNHLENVLKVIGNIFKLELICERVVSTLYHLPEGID